jgi:hypothetical protein
MGFISLPAPSHAQIGLVGDLYPTGISQASQAHIVVTG